MPPTSHMVCPGTSCRPLGCSLCAKLLPPAPIRPAAGLLFTSDLVDDPLEPPLHLPALEPVLAPDEEEVEDQQEEESAGVHQLHTLAGRKERKGGDLVERHSLSPA